MILSRPNETLDKHIERVVNSYKSLCKNKGIDKILINLFNKLETKENIKNNINVNELILNVLKLHDDGKKNKYFQSYVENEEYLKYKVTNDNKEHSIISAYYFLGYYKPIIESKTNTLKGRDKRKIKGKLVNIILACAYIISKHHGNLQDVNYHSMLERIEDKHTLYNDCYNNYNQEIVDYYKKNKELENCNYELYIFIKLLYSVLVTCDFMAVLEFNQNKPLDLNLINKNKINQFKYNFENNNIIKGIRNTPLEEMTTVNKYRSQMFLESESNLRKENNNMYYLEAPTGSGKSLTSLNLALNMIDDTYNKIYYVAPFINILEQTYKDINNTLGNLSIKDVALINNKESIITEDCDIYEEEYLSSQMINYPLSIISHVKLFDILFGNKRIHNMMLPLFCNSVIILDEIQSYKNSIWIDIINSLKEYSEALNLKIVIMSATLPKLDVLLDDKDYKISNLITNKKYYYDFFKTRCDCDFSLLNKTFNEKTLYDKIDDVINESNKTRILIGLIKVKTCNKIYNDMLKYKNKGYEIYKITGNTNTFKRNSIIKKLKEKDDNGNYVFKKVILVATQCIEAGVDIDMNIGFKNISLLDSDEQFMGRIERNFNNKGIVYYFKLDELGYIYKDDYRSERTLLNKEWQEILSNKDFDKFYERNYTWLIRNEQDNHLNILNCFKKLKFNFIYNNLKLINENTKVNIILEFDYIDEYNNVISFNYLNNKYKNLKYNFSIGYGEREIKLSKYKKKLDIFNFQINTYDLDKIGILELRNDEYYISNASRFFDNLTDDKVSNESEFNIDRLLAS